MALNEFELIERYFRHCGAEGSDVRVGVGDDAAVLRCAAGLELVATTDTLVAGVHFPLDSPPRSLGHRALAVNLSDLAAMGARPRWALLALTLPAVDEGWVAAFAAGLDALARTHAVALVGGNTTSGPLTITLQLLGQVPTSRALLRSGARAGEGLFVSGTTGDAAAGLALEQGRLASRDTAASTFLRERFLYPSARVALGEQLRDYASACIDVSDGLLGDAGKLAAASGAGVEIVFEDLSVSPSLVATVGEERARELALMGGEDYELCFTVPTARLEALQRSLPPERWDYRRIGIVRDRPGAIVMRAGSVMEFADSGFDHFAPKAP